MDKKKVVVIGYGGGGSKLVGALAKTKKYAITVVNPFDYMEVSVLMTKALAEGRVEHEKALFPLLQEEGVEYVIDICTAITNNSVTTKSGKTIPFDACIVAVGHNIPLFFPDVSQTTRQQRMDAVQAAHEQIVNAKTIVISGGGPVGSEAAADIKLRYKDKKIYLVHSHGEVLNMMKNAFRLKATTYLESIGVDLVLGDKVTKFENGTAFLSSGKELSGCDMHIVAHPLGGNAAAFMPSNSVDDKGYVKVNEKFEVEGMENVFSFGDCSNFDPVKVYPRLDDQLTTLVPNVEAKLAGKPLKEHKRGATLFGSLQGPMMVALGHGLEEGYGVGPDLPGCTGFCCWLCCCCGPPCSTPAGKGVAKAKTDFNYTVVPQIGKGIAPK